MKNNFYRLLLLPLLLLAAWGARAQAPAWVGATGITAGQASNSVVQAMATNAAGDIFVAGTYNSSATFGSTTLSSNGGTDDLFVAKWSTTSNNWVWAVSGGGGDTDGAYGIAVNGANVYVTGSYTTSATISGTSLTGVAGTSANPDLFVAKYVDGGTTVSNGGAITGGSGGSDRGTSIGFNGTTVYVAGYYTGTSGASISGSSLPGAANNNVFLAKYTDNGTTLQAGGAVASATSSTERATCIAVNGTAIYIGGYFNGSSLTFGSTTLTGAGGQDMFIARYNDSGTLTPAGAISNGGAGFERITGLAVNGTSVYATGYFSSSPITIAGTSLSAGTTGSNDVFVAKYTYSGSSFSGAGALGNSSTDTDDLSYALAANGSTIYITGVYGGATTLSGTALPAPAGGADIFVAKYTDASGLQPQGALAAGTTSTGTTDIGTAIAATSTQAFVGGIKDPAAAATFGSFSVPAGPSAFLARVGVNATTVTSIVPANASPTNASSVQFTVTFAASVTGVTTSNFTTSNGTGLSGSSVTSVSGSGTTYTVTVNTGSGSGTLSLTLANDTGLTPSISNEPFTGTPLYTIDKTAPTVVISSTAGGSGSTTNTTPIPFTITFSESVTGFVAGDVAVTGGTLSGFSGSGTTYTFTVTPSSSGSVTVNVAANTAQDAVGNGNTAATQFNITYQQPLVVSSQAVTVNLSANGTGTLNASSVNNGSSGSGTLTYTIQKIAYGRVTEGNTLTLTTPNGTNFTAIRFASYGTPTSDANGNYRLGSCNAANSVTTAQNSFVGRSTGSMDAQNVSSANNNPTLGDPCGGTPKALAVQAAYSADANSLTYDCTEAGKTQYVLLTVTDGSGNSSTSVAQVSVNPPPTATISSVSPTAAQRGATVTVAGTNLSGVTSVTVNGATASVSGLSATGFTFVVPSGATLGTGNLTVAAPCAQTLTSTFNVTAPPLTATVSTTSSSPTSTSPIPFSVSFSQSVGTTFTASDVTVSGGTLTSGSFSGSGSGPYTFTVTPTSTGTVTVSLAANVATDANNTGNSASNSVSVQFQTPTITIAPASLPQGTQGTAYSQALSASGGSGTYTYAITAGALPAGLTLTNGTIAGTPNVNGSFTFTVTATDNSAAPGPYSGSRSYTLAINPPPTVTVTSVTRLTPSPTATTTVSYRVIFSGTVTGLTASNFDLATTGLSGAAVTNVSGSGSSYTVLVNTGTGDGTLRLNVANSTSTSPAISNVPYTSGEVYTITKSFVAAPTLRIQAAGSASGNGDVTAFVDLVQVLQSGTSTAVANGVQNASFETNNVAAGNYLYQSQGVVASPWSFGGTQAGISRNNSGFGSTAADGDAVTFLQSAGGNNGNVSQNLAVPTGSYQVRFRTMQRNYTSLDQRLSVFVNDVYVGIIQPNNIPTYDTFTSASFSVTAPALVATVSTTSASPTGTAPIPFSVSFTDGTNPQSVGSTFTASDVTVSGGTVTSGSFSGSGAGPYTFTVTPSGFGTVTVSLAANVAQDANNTGNSASNSVSVQFQAPTITVAPATLPAGTRGTAYSQALSAAGGTAPYTFAITAGALPSGLTLSSAGLLSGTPAASGSFTFTVTATDASAAPGPYSGSRSYTLTIAAPAIVLAPATLPNGTVATAYSQTLTASGGTAPYTFAITAGALPAGLTLTSAGVLAGTPTAGGSFTFTVTATDASTNGSGGPYSGSQSYTLTVAAPTIAVAPTTLPGGTQGTAYSQTITASGGTAPYTFAITAGALPAGLSLSNGTIAGTPTTNGSFTFTVTATDASTGSGPYTGSRSYTLVIAAPAVTAVTWTGTISTDWFTAGNWSPNQVPTASLDVTIPTAPSGGRFPFLSAGTANVRNLTFNSGATLNQAGGTLVVAANLTNNGTFQPTGGTVVLGNTNPSNILGSSNTRFWNLTIGASGAQQSTSANTSVQRLLLLNGNFATNGNSFTINSTANLTAQVTNNGGVVNGNVTVQRYIDPSLNPNLGYRHISTAVSGQTVSSLATGSFSPVVNPTYNASAQPGTTTPFPTVYGYDQSRLATATNNLSTFDKGWFSPNALSDALNVGQGYTALIGGGQTWAFTGALNNGTQTLTLARNTGATAADAGLSLVGNPYPSPLDWRQVASNGLSNVDGALYVFQSNDPSNPYAGAYGVYANNVGTISPILAQGQGFFVRVTQGQTSGTLTFANSQRPTTYTATNYARTAAETRPLVQLSLKAAGRSTGDDAFVYFESGSTEGFDAQYDARKMPNPSGLNLSTTVGGEQYSIDGRPAIGTVQRVIPLAVGVPAAGAYSLSTAQLVNLDTTPVYLRDLQAGTLTDLRLTPSYQFTVSNASALITNRFELVFSPQQALATVPAALAQQVALYPNPAKKAAFVELPASLGRQAVTATLVDALGRSVRTVSLPAQGALAHQLDLSELATGVYALRLSTSAGVVVKKLVIE